MKKIILLIFLLLTITLVYAQENATEILEENATNITTELTLPSPTETATSTLITIKESITQNPLKYTIGLIVLIIIIFFIYSALEKDQEKRIDNLYRKAEKFHKIAEEYHQDGFPNLAEQTHQKAEKYRQKAREAKINL